VSNEKDRYNIAKRHTFDHSKLLRSILHRTIFQIQKVRY